MEGLTRLARDKRVILGLAAAVLLIKAVIAVPTWDDEVWASHIVGPRPYYNDYVGLQMPILKPMVTVQLPARLVHYPWNFLYVSLLKTALIVAAGMAHLQGSVALRGKGRRDGGGRADAVSAGGPRLGLCPLARRRGC